MCSTRSTILRCPPGGTHSQSSAVSPRRLGRSACSAFPSNASSSRYSSVSTAGPAMATLRSNYGGSMRLLVRKEALAGLAAEDAERDHATQRGWRLEAGLAVLLEHRLRDVEQRVQPDQVRRR